MAAAHLASGFIDLTVRYKEAQKEIRRAFEGEFDIVEKSADKAGARAGKRLGANLSKELGKELRDAGDKGSKELLRGLSSGEAQAEQRVRKAAQGYAKALQDGMKGGGEEAARKWESEFRSALGARNQIRNLKVKVDTDRSGFDVLKRDLENLRRSDFVKINLGALGIAGLPAIASGIAEVAASLQQLSQAALAVPGGIAGVVSSVGTLAFGLTGITDAYEALNKVSDEQAKSGRDVANQARAQQSAEYSLRNALVDQKDARNDVSRAMRDQRRELQDLSLEMRGGLVSEKRAVLEASKARERLYSGDFSDYREALLDVEEADLRVEEVRTRNIRNAEDLNEAHAKGVQGSDRVVAANERLIRSDQSVAQAQGAVAAAADTTTSAQEDAALAMGKLSQNGQAFVNALMNVQGPIQGLRNLVQDRIFAGLDTELLSLTSEAMPTFERGLGAIGDAWNGSFREIFRLAKDKDNLGIIERIFGNTADAQKILTNGLEPLTTGLLTLTEAGTDVLPRLAEGFNTVAERFSAFITAADEDGRLNEWIDEGLTAFGHLGETMLNLGKIFKGITDATSGSFLANLERWTTKWATWINSVEGQTALKDFFAEGARVWEQWRPVLEDLPGIFKSIYDAASSFSAGVSQILSPITEVLKDFPILVEAAAMAFLIFKSAQVIGAVTTLLGKLTGLSTMLSTTLPDDAKKGAGKINAALALIAVPMIGKMITDEIDEWLKENYPDLYNANHSNTPGDLGKSARDWLDKNVFGEDDFKSSPKYGPLPTGGASVLQSILSGDVPKFEGGSARQFAHEKMLPFWESKGFTVGDHQADKYGEHQNGALDIMVPSIEEGNAVLQKVLSDPNVYGAIFNNQSYGYGQGSDPRPYSGGFTGNPTQDHKDHVHVWYKPGGENNIAPILLPPPVTGPPAPGPAAPAPPAAPGMPGIPGLFPPTPPSGPTPGSAFDLFGPPRKFDTGGWWPDGVLGVNTTGQDELVLNPDHLDNLAKQGVDPNSLIHGQNAGAAPGPGAGSDMRLAPEQVQQLAGQGINADQLLKDPMQAVGDVGRTGGYIPAAAGNTSVAGTSFLSGIYGMGAEVINGMIDQAASVASSAAGMAASAFAPGSGGAASGLAQAGIGMATGAVKRGVEYGAQMLGIFTDSLIEQATPFGAPRLLTTDPTGFMPQQLLSQVMGKMIQPGQIPGQVPGQPGQPAQTGAPAIPGMPADHAGTGAAPGVPNPPGPPPGVVGAIGQAQADPNQQTALDFLKPIIPTIHDQGGWLPPGGIAMNLTKKAEPMPVFNTDQWGTLNSIANSPISEPAPSGGGGDYRMVFEAGSVVVKDVTEFERKMQDRQSLQSMRYRGRPR